MSSSVDPSPTATPEPPSGPSEGQDVRSWVLQEAGRIVSNDRAKTYGGPEDSFRVIADYWSVHLGVLIQPSDVAIMMALLKVARLRGNRTHADSWIDGVGYLACGAEVADKEG